MALSSFQAWQASLPVCLACRFPLISASSFPLLSLFHRGANCGARLSLAEQRMSLFAPVQSEDETLWLTTVFLRRVSTQRVFSFNFNLIYG